MNTSSMLRQSYPPMIRHINPRKDLFAIADLIELCFADTLDQSGRDYISQLRQVAGGTASFWIGLSGNHIYTPREGLVWEEEGMIVGNLSIFPFQTPQGIEYLIANVAVHPDFRRRGIARLLTERALEYIRQRGGRRAWLNVREDNTPAYLLYCSLDFVERLRRTTWQYRPTPSPSQADSTVVPSLPAASHQVRRRASAEWEMQKRWLLSTYPPDYHWHLDFQLDSFAPGFFSWLRALLSDSQYEHYSIIHHDHLIGIATLQSTLREEQYLWMACDPSWENKAFELFVNHFLRPLASKKKISLDYPAQRAIQPLRDFGFVPQQTLIWMYRSIPSSLSI